MKSENKEKYRNNRNMQIKSEKIKLQNDMRNLGVHGTFHHGDTRFG